jgi:predicted amidophosphoribosyltransferase
LAVGFYLLMTLSDELLDLFFPAKCILCDLQGYQFCQNCILEFENYSHQVRRGGLTGYSVCYYNNGAAKLIHEFKENSKFALAKPMAASMAKLLLGSEIGLVPMPSKKGSFGKRGFTPAKVLANQIALEIFRGTGSPIRVFDALQLFSDVKDQAALSGTDRRLNLIGAMSLAKPFKNKTLLGAKLRQSRIWLIDDIVTTGSTLLEARRCLESIGVQVAGFITYADTRPKNRQNDNEEGV